MIKKKKSALEKEVLLLEKREQAFLKKNASKKESVLNQALSQKVPKKLQSTLDAAFTKAFYLIFDKGTGVIEKTYSKEQVEFDHKVSEYAAGLKENKKTLRIFAARAGKTANMNLILTTVEGIGLGALGIGLPDIPIFTGVILKSLYEISKHYGYDYKTAEEKYFILKIIQGALSYGETLEEVNQQVDQYISTETLPAGYEKDTQISETSKTLSGELLYMKFLQGIPIAGVIGGAYDTMYLKKITDYGRIKYQKRFLLNKTDDSGGGGR